MFGQRGPASGESAGCLLELGASVRAMYSPGMLEGDFLGLFSQDATVVKPEERRSAVLQSWSGMRQGQQQRSLRAIWEEKDSDL